MRRKRSTVWLLMILICLQSPIRALASDVTPGSTQREAQKEENAAGDAENAADEKSEFEESEFITSESISEITSEDVSEFTSEFITEDMTEETPEDLPEQASFASIDVSFISLKKVLSPVRELLVPEGEIVALIKPQFEAGRDKVGKHGVVRDPAVHEEVIREVMLFASSAGLAPLALTSSPIRGPEGNIEYLLYLKKGQESGEPDLTCIRETVQKAHETL